MTYQPLLFVAVLLLGAALFGWLIYREVLKERRRSAQLELKQRERDVSRCADIEEGLRDWLMTLELPQFEEQTRLEVAAHQLRIVLVERLMRGPRIP